MSKQVSISQLLSAIKKLPSDSPIIDARKWYQTQQQHWIGWLKEYRGPGAYNRKTGINRSARFVYNHIVEPKMLLWLATAAGIAKNKVKDAKAAAILQKSMNQQSSAIRRIIPWQTIEKALFHVPTIR